MSQIRYTKDHEYVRVEDGEGVVGISEHAQQQLGDVVFAEAPPIGKALKKGDPAAVVESVKAASDVFAPVLLESGCQLSRAPVFIPSRFRGHERRSGTDNGKNSADGSGTGT